MTARLLLYGIFVLSGAAGLIYESVWVRYLGLFVGHNAYAQVLVITIFLGGMALGAWLIGTRSERLNDPLKWYAAIEVIVGAISLFFHDIYQLVTGIAYESLFPALAGGPLLTIVKWVIAAALILPQSVLLGTTFPLMGAGVLRRFGTRPGRVLAILYFANSLGAAAGVLVAGFYLLSLAGLPGTLLVGGMVNLLVGLLAYGIAWQTPSHGPRATEAVDDRAPTGATAMISGEWLRRVLLGVAFGTAVASFMYEIAWLRMLSLVLGSATHSFELMLSAFILGLALGSFWVRTRADRWTDPLRALAVVQLLMGFAALATLPLYSESFEWMSRLQRTFAGTTSGYLGFNLARYAICMIVMVPSTFCAGITLPLITRTLLVRGVGERAIGAVYGINTLGSISGVALAGLALMPLLGVRLMLITGAALDMALGVSVLWLAARSGFARRPALVSGVIAATLVLVASVGTDIGRHMVASGVFRGGRLYRPDQVTVHSHRDGRTATVTVSQVVESDMISIATNGKADGSYLESWIGACADTVTRHPLMGDMATQALAPLITLAHRPNAREVGVIGHGTGLTSHYLLASPLVERLSTIEIEPQMIRGSRVYYPANARVFDDPRSHIVVDDARTFMAATPRTFDLIFSEPSNPWVSGVSGLFTAEFYGHVARHLGEDGVFGQWLHLYELNDGLVLSVLAALHRHFGSYEIFQTSVGDVVIVAAKSALARPDWSLFALASVRGDLCRAVPPTPEALEAARLLHRAALAPLLDTWEQPNSDFFPILDLSAERARFLSERSVGLQGLAAETFDFTAPFFERRAAPPARAAVSIGGIPRLDALAVAAGLHDRSSVRGVDSTTLPGRLAGAEYRRAQWRAMLRDPAPPSAWAIWLDNFRLVSSDLHGGTKGYADAAFYREAERYLARHDAPARVRQAEAFDRALAAWDFATASRMADSLLPIVTEGTNLLGVDYLMDGAVAAKLLLGDAAGATRVREALGALPRRSATDLRSRLLDAYLDAFTAAANDREPPSATTP